MAKKQFKKFILEKDAKMKDTTTCNLNMEKNVAAFETEKKLLKNPIAKQLGYARGKQKKSTRTKDSLIETISSV